MKANLRTYRITSVILMIVCAGLLVHSNHQKNRAAEIVDQYFDLQEEYEKIFDDVQELEEYSERLENQVDILTNFIVGVDSMSPAEFIEYESIDPTIE